jgi:hypothetical protein
MTRFGWNIVPVEEGLFGLSAIATERRGFAVRARVGQLLRDVEALADPLWTDGHRRHSLRTLLLNASMKASFTISPVATKGF